MRVEVFSVMRTYSSSPSRRCAFSIGVPLLLQRSLCQLECSSIRVNQTQFICPAFSMMNDLGVAIFFNKGCHMLDRTPARDVPVLSVSEDAVQQSRGTQKPDMAAMQWRDGTATRNVLMRHQQRGHLLPCARLRQEVFQQVVRKTTIVQRRVSGRRNGIGCAHTWLQLREFEKAPIDANVLEL